jgi:hypothetical protein
MYPCNNTEESNKDLYIINTFDELISLANSTTAIEQRKNSHLTLEILLEKFQTSTVICITDILIEKNYKDCGINTNGEIIILLLDNSKSSQFIGTYLEDSMKKLKCYHTYTVKSKKDTICNLIIKKELFKGTWSVIITQGSNVKYNMLKKNLVWYKQIIYITLVVILAVILYCNW